MDFVSIVTHEFLWDYYTINRNFHSLLSGLTINMIFLDILGDQIERKKNIQGNELGFGEFIKEELNLVKDCDHFLVFFFVKLVVYFNCNLYFSYTIVFG